MHLCTYGSPLPSNFKSIYGRILTPRTDKYPISAKTRTSRSIIYSLCNYRVGCKFSHQWRKHCPRRQSCLRLGRPHRQTSLNMSMIHSSSGKLFESLTIPSYPSWPCSISFRFWCVSFFIRDTGLCLFLIILQDRSNIGEKYMITTSTRCKDLKSHTLQETLVLLASKGISI